MNFYRFAQGLRLGMSPEVADSMTKVYKGGDKQKTEAVQNTVQTPAQQAQYNNLLQGADAWKNWEGFDKNYGGSADFNPVAGFTPEQQAALKASGQTGQQLQDLYNTQGVSSLSNFLGAYDPSKTGLTGAIDASNNRLDWNYGTTVAPQVRQGATGAGQFGSTRHGVAEGIALSNLSQQKTDAASTLAYQDQQAYNQNQLNALNNLSGITKGLNSGSGLQFDAGTLQQQQNQAQISGDLQKWAYENNVSLNDLLAYQQLISGNMGGTNVGQGTNTGGGRAGGGGAGMAAGALGGAAAGATVGSVGGPIGTAVGAGVGAIAGAYGSS
jgi:hypothetical protein